MSELLEHRVLPSILPLEKWTASSQYPKERRYSTYMGWFVADIREKAREIVWADENVPLSKSEPDPEDEDWVYGSFYNDDLEMGDTLAMILSKPGVHVDGLIMAGWCVVNEARQSGIRPFFDYKQFAGKLPRFAKTLKIRELCYQARQTLKQEKVDQLPDVPRLDDDIRMADLLVPLLKKDQHDIQLAMKQARKTILLDIAECRGLQAKQTC